MLFQILMAASLAQADPLPSSHSTPTVVVTGHLSKAANGQVKVDTTVHVDDEDVSERYGPIWPAKAYEYRVGGHVTLACKINSRGFAQSCEIADETPSNMGFGEAALQIQPGLRVNPPAAIPATGSVLMNIGVKFDPPVDAGIEFGGINVASGIVSGTATFTRLGEQTNPRTGLPIIMEPVTMINHPIWSAAPSFEDMRHVYPTGAKTADGFVVLRCKVDQSGSLKGCDVTKEEPEKQGFNRAALSLAPLFHIAPEVMAKAPKTKAMQVVLPIRFAPDALTPEPVVESPSWVSGFDPQTAPKLFPPEAVASGLTTGRGVARCVVGSDGSLTGCSPEAGDSDSAGFSDAAVVLASTLKMNLWSVNASPVRGGIVRVPVRLNLAPPT